MKLATGAVECLSRGAAHDDPDVNAVGPNGDLFEAGQMVTEGDAELRRSLDVGIMSFSLIGQSSTVRERQSEPGGRGSRNPKEKPYPRKENQEAQTTSAGN